MKAVLIGAGGHGRVVLDAARRSGAFDVIAVIDRRPDLKGVTFEGVEIIGDETALPVARERGATAILLGVGSVDVGDARKALYERIERLGFSLPTVVHPAAVVSPSASVGAASVIFAGVVVNPSALIGTNVIVNTAAIVEHDVRIGDHTHVSPGAHIAGGSAIGERTHVGIGATLLQGVRVGNGVVIGAGAVVLRDVSDGDRVVGVPARSIRRA